MSAVAAELRHHRTWQVPRHTVTEFRPKRAKYSVCIPVINEGERITSQLKRMQDAVTKADLIIADGGSTDGSVAPDPLQALGVRTLLVKNGPGGLSAQLRMGLSYALTEGYEGVITMDGNNKDDPDAIAAFVEALDEGFDHVQGSRFIPGGLAVNTPWYRLLAIRLVHAPLVSLSAGFRYTDTTNGFRAYSRRLLLDPRVAPFRELFAAYELHYYLAIRAVRLGYRVKELPVTRRYPARGPTPTKIRSLRGYWNVMRALRDACLHRFDPPPHA